mgnify:CR=1 FL=1
MHLLRHPQVHPSHTHQTGILLSPMPEKLAYNPTTFGAGKLAELAYLLQERLRNSCTWRHSVVKVLMHCHRLASVDLRYQRGWLDTPSSFPSVKCIHLGSSALDLRYASYQSHYRCRWHILLPQLLAANSNRLAMHRKVGQHASQLRQQP